MISELVGVRPALNKENELLSTEKPHITLIYGEWHVLYQNDCPFISRNFSEVVAWLKEFG